MTISRSIHVAANGIIESGTPGASADKQQLCPHAMFSPPAALLKAPKPQQFIASTNYRQPSPLTSFFTTGRLCIPVAAMLSLLKPESQPWLGSGLSWFLVSLLFLIL